MDLYGSERVKFRLNSMHMAKNIVTELLSAVHSTNFFETSEKTSHKNKLMNSVKFEPSTLYDVNNSS